MLMLLVLKPNVSEDDLKNLIRKIKEMGFEPHVSRGVERTLVGVIGHNAIAHREEFEPLEYIETITPISKPYKLASREWKKEDTVIKIGNVSIGGKKIVIIAGPCTVESKPLLLQMAKDLKGMGASILRGGAFKPRTSPYSFQGLGEEALEYLAAARNETGMLVVTEAMNINQVASVAKYADIIQIGARNVQNYDLLKEVGRSSKPVLLKRGMATTIEELLLSAEYILSRGNPNVILCERGIRTFENATRNTLDLSMIPLIKEMSHLPVIVDPSHATGRRELILPMSRAAIAAGADGIMIEVHSNPEEALVDGAESIRLASFPKLMHEVGLIAKAVGREI